MKLAMYKGKGTFYDKLIRFITNSPYSHCELVIGNLCYSSSPRDRGVRMKHITLDDNWDVYHVRGSEIDALEWFVTNAGKKYDLLGAISSILPFKFGKANEFFCSEACAYMLQIPNPAKFTPQSLLDRAI